MTQQEHPEMAPTLALLDELRKIYASEGGSQFVNGISNVGWLLNRRHHPQDQCWHDAAHAYLSLAQQKAGFSDFYVDRMDSQQRIEANVRLDTIRMTLWEIFWPLAGA